ncbi:MAG: hypothetical protein AWU57_806 [Marinobacter sp. T13-3]|nr:MAG: hypothetical protein AWU57_806 [Marinobacter sp. T13-3]
MFGAILATISSAATAVVTAVKTLGPAVANFAAKVAPTVTAMMDKIPGLLSKVSNIASTFLGLTNIFQPGEKVEDMGEASLQAASDGITPDKFNNFDEYMDSLRNYKTDPEIAKERSSLEKTVAGMAIGTVGLEEKYNANPGDFKDIWLEVDPEIWTGA